MCSRAVTDGGCPGGIKRLADTALVAQSSTAEGPLQLPRAGT
jgi:hypothetical protein